jgi:hypothetical protein
METTFVLPLPPRYQDDSTVLQRVENKSVMPLQIIKGYIMVATLLMGTLTEPVTAVNTLEETKGLTNIGWAFLDSLSWHISIPFKHILSTTVFPPEYVREIKLLEELKSDVAAFKNLVRTVGLKWGDDPFTRPASITAPIPAQSIWELHVQILCLKRGLNTIG